MPPQLLVQSQLLPQPLPRQQELPAVVEDRGPLAQVVKVTRVDLLQLLTPLTSDSPTVAVGGEISGRSGRTNG
jgi:hypothetical protein